MTLQEPEPPGRSLPVMQTRKDLYAAHRLMTQRASLALLRGQPDVPDLPMRRLNVAAFAGALVALIAAALLIIWGIVRPTSVALEPGHHYLVIDSDTGTPFVFCEKTRLCPAVNYASARLALDVPDPQQQSVTQSALRAHPVGPRIGIPGLPDLPVPGLLVRRPWSVCDRAGGTADTTTLAGGYAPGGARLGNRSLLVQAEGQDWVIWHNTRHLIAPSLLSVLGSQPVPAAAVWLNALPAGSPFAAPQLPGQGSTASGPLGPAKVGQVYLLPAAAGKQYYVLLQGGGLARISVLQEELLQLGGTKAPQQLTPAQASRSFRKVLSLGGLPAAPPPVVTGARAGMRCVVYGAGPGSAAALRRQVLVGGAMPVGGVPTGEPASVTQVYLPNGTGALVGSAPAPGSARGVVNYFLVSGGKRYALASPAVAPVLGYTDLARQAVVLPASVVGLIPQGPVLSPAAARRQAPAG